MHLTFRDGSRALRRSGFHSDAEVHLSNERTTAENTSGILPALSQPTLNVNMGGWHGFKSRNMLCSAKYCDCWQGYDGFRLSIWHVVLPPCHCRTVLEKGNDIHRCCYDCRSYHWESISGVKLSRLTF